MSPARPLTHDRASGAAPSADARQLFGEGQVDHARAADFGLQQHHPGCAATARPMMAASRPSGVPRMAASTASAIPAPRTPPACLRWRRTAGRARASRRRRAPSSRTGMRAASTSTPTPEASAISHSDRAPGRRGWGRAGRGFRPAASMASTSRFSGAVSDRMAPSNSSPSRFDMTAMPWSPIVPLTRIASPGRALDAEMFTPGRHHADARRGDEQLVGGAAVHHLGIAGDDDDARRARPPRPWTASRAPARPAAALPP